MLLRWPPVRTFSLLVQTGTSIQTGAKQTIGINQSQLQSHSDANRNHYSAANDKVNCHSPNLLCSVQENPKWYSDWNTEMQMQYMETYQHQNYVQDTSQYDVFQGIKSVYSNFLEDEEGYHSSADDASPNQNTNTNSHVKQEVNEVNSSQNNVTPLYRQATGPNSNTVSSETAQRTGRNGPSASVQIKTEPCSTPVIGVGQRNPSPIWRPW